MAAQTPGERVPHLVRIPDELQEFLESVHVLAGDLENGTFELTKPEDAVVWGDITWTKACVVRPGMIGFPSEDLADFEFKCSVEGTNEEWQFRLTREALAQIANGTLTHLSLYFCANPVCGFKSSSERGRCPRCYLEAGVPLRGPHSHRVRGICPNCGELLAALDARHCPRCGHDSADAHAQEPSFVKPREGAS
jgi:hypothetical protein